MGLTSQICSDCGNEMRLVWSIPPKEVVYGVRMGEKSRYRTKSLYQYDKCKRVDVR